MILLDFDLLVGFLYGLLTFQVIGWLSLLTAVLSALFWAVGGQKGHAWRFCGCTAVVYGPFLWTTPYFLHWVGFGSVISVTGSMLLLSMGYGIPSTQPLDQGSFLGRYFWRITGEDLLLTDALTRGTIYTGLVFLYEFYLWYGRS